MNASPNMAGKDRNAVKRSIFRRTPNWACRVIGDFCQDGLCYAAYRTADERVSHSVPFVGLGVVAHFLFREETA